MPRTRHALHTLLFIAIAVAQGHAQSAASLHCDPGQPIKDPSELKVIRSCTEAASYFTTTESGPTGRVVVLVYGLEQYRRAYEAQQKKDPQIDPSQLILYVDGRPLPRFYGQLPDHDHSHLTFDFKQLVHSSSGNAESLSAWKVLLTDGIRDRKMTLSVGFPTRGPVPTEVDDFEIDAISDLWLTVWVVLTGALLGLLWWAGYASDMLRVPGCPPPAPAANTPAPRKAYSLARAQMAAWFFAVLVAYVFIYLVTGALDTLSATVLGLMGISAATGFGATIVDTATLPPGATAAPSEGILADLMREGTGMSLPRLQIAFWTIVLLFIFGRAIYDTLAMPDFSPTLLGLMGISGGTYVGFKLPDKKS
jgi:hypothetical protein